MDAVAIAASLRELAVYLRLERDPYRARAYETAARTVEAIHDLDRRVAEGTLTELPGIGDSIASVVAALHQHGEVSILRRLRDTWPRAIVELSFLPGVGLKKARQLVETLAPADLDELTAMAEAGRVREVPGFGKASEAKLLAALRGRHEREDRMILADARRLSKALADFLGGAPEADAVHVCGGARRWLEVVDELVLVVETSAPAAIRERLRRHPLVLELADGPEPDTAVFHLAPGGRGLVRTAPPALAGAAQILATGSRAHVEQLHARAAAAGLDLAAIPGDEAAVYAALGLPFLPPEVRDGDDELACADAGERFDDLVTLADVTGAVHCHTHYSDGRHSIAEMAAAAAARGLAFLTITDHSQSAHYANGLDVERLHQQWAEMAEVQATTPVALLRGIEADILADGRLDVPEGADASLDVLIASIHSRHKLDEDGMTRRLVAAMRARPFKIWGHGLGRMLLRRDPIACRVDEVLDAVAESRAAIELNGDPHRLDLPPIHARAARRRGIRFVLSSDAHSTSSLDYVANAVGLARRARLRPADVLNTLPADAFRAAVRPIAT